MDYEIIGTIQEQNLTKCLNDMLYKKLNSLTTCDYLNCKVFEWNYIENENLSTVLDNLKSCYAQYQPKLVGHINKWCEIYGK